MILRDSEIWFLYMYKVLEYFFLINRKNEIQKIAAKWIKNPDKLSKEIETIYRTGEQDCLKYLLKNPCIKNDVENAIQTAFENGIISLKVIDEFADKLYSFRNSIVHGKLDVRYKLYTPNLLSDFQESPWFTIIHILAFGCIREFCYEGRFSIPVK